MAVDIVIQETIDSVDITVTPNIIEVNVTRTSGGGAGSQTLAQTLDLGNTTGGENILVNNADAIELENGSLLQKGTYDYSGGGGISRICSVGYEDMWQAGIRHVFDNNGLIRHSTNCFDVVPDSTFDNTLRFKVDSLWTLDNGTTYKCTDATEGAAVWEIVIFGATPTLQQVLDNNHDLVNGNFFAGDSAGDGNLGIELIAIGVISGIANEGSKVNALGFEAAGGNLAENVNAFGSSAGVNNTFNNVNLLGQNAQADENGQTVLSKDGTIMARISTTDLTASRKYTLQDADGTLAFLSDITGATPTLQEVLDNNHDLVDGNFFVGNSAGIDNTGNNVNALGESSAVINAGNYVNSLGFYASYANTGNNVNALGNSAALGNSGNYVNALGFEAGVNNLGNGNTFNNVNLFGESALADEDGQTVLSKDGTIMARISTVDLTASRKYTLQDADGTLAFLSDITGGGVPYTGATQDVDLGEFGLLTGNIEFDNTPTNIPTAAGSMVWNDTDGTVDLKLKGGNVTLQIGQENLLRVVNKTATNINLLEANYQAVRVTGAQGQRLKVDLAQATTDALSAETIGLVTETINNNQEGFITTSGLIRNVNTTGSLQSETWADGDILYLSPTTAGQLTKVKPTAPNHLVIVGYVVHAHATQGSIFVKVDNGYELNELHNVKITSETNGQALTYTSATDIWENKTIIQDSITDGVTTIAPSQNAVFDLFQFTRRLITNGTGSVTGTTAETILTSLTIPANTLDSKCFIWSTMDYFKSSAANCTLRLYINTANSLSGATLIGFATVGSNRNVSFNRKLYLNGTTLDFLSSNTGATQINNEFIEAIFGASTTLTVNPANDIFLIYTTQNDAVGTTATSKQATVQKLKLN